MENNYKDDTILKSICNFRRVYVDVRNENGTVKLRPLQLYRSSKLDGLKKDDLDIIRNQLKIKTNIDCRSSSEYSRPMGGNLLDKEYNLKKLIIPKNHKNFDQVVYKPLNKTQHETDGFNHFLLNFYNLSYIKAIFLKQSITYKVFFLICLFIDLISLNKFQCAKNFGLRIIVKPYGLIQLYKDMINHSQYAIFTALKIISQKENLPVVINCALGKDRTGILCALVQSLSGASREYIIQDYVRSEHELEPNKRAILEEVVDEHKLDESFTRSKPETITNLLDYIDQEYGSLENYCDYIGFNKNDRDALFKSLIAQEN